MKIVRMGVRKMRGTVVKRLRRSAQLEYQRQIFKKPADKGFKNHFRFVKELYLRGGTI